MKTTIITLATAFFATALFAESNPKDTMTVALNTAKSEVYWTGKKVTGEHTGTLKLKSGLFTVSDDKPIRIEANLDMTSILVTDIEDPGTNAKLLGHLKSDDFFSVEKHPVGKFVAESFTPISGAEGRDANYKVKGNLTLKGITKPVEFDAYIAMKGGMALANAEVKIDRTHWDIKFRSGSFFENLGDKTIYDDVEIILVVVAGS